MTVHQLHLVEEIQVLAMVLEMSRDLLTPPQRRGLDEQAVVA
jgi:hypothetical protein